MITPGTVFAPKGSKPKRGRELVVVYRIGKDGSVFYDGLNNGTSGAVCHGYSSTAHFLEWWEPVAQMTFGGAWKRYQDERYKRSRLIALINHAVELLHRRI